MEDVNEKHLIPWGEICQRDGINITPLSPFIDMVKHLIKFERTSTLLDLE